MSRIAPPSITSLPVVPGTAIVTPMYTSVGFNAGDYVYQYSANLVGWPKPATVDVGINNTMIGATIYSTPIYTTSARSASYGPFTEQAVYTGTTITAGSVALAPVTLNTGYPNSSNNWTVKSVVLQNGNMMFIYPTAGGTLSAAVYNSTGALQGTVQTVSTDVNLNDWQTLKTCVLGNGFVVVTHRRGSDGYLGYVVLNASGVSQYSVYPFSSSYTMCDVAAVGPGNASSWTSGLHFGAATDNAGYAIVRIYSSYNSFYGTYNCYSINSGDGMYALAMAPMANGNVTVLFGDNTYGTFQAQTFNYTGSSVGSTGGMGSFSATYRAMYGVATTPASGATTTNTAMFVVKYSNGNNYRVAISGTSGSMSLVLGAGYQYSNTIGSLTNGGYVVADQNGSGTISVNILNSSNTSIGTASISGAYSGYGGAPVVAGFSNGKCVISYCNTSGNPVFSILNTQNLTSGDTVLTNSAAYTPANNYYLLGVALTSASAGSTGLVVTNGNASLGSSFPSVSSNILFDCTGSATTARSAINANRGNVIGTTVTLRGYE